MDFFATLAVVRELREKLNYITDLLEILSEKVNQIELTVNLEHMSVASLVEDSEEDEKKSPAAPGRLGATAKPDQT